MPGYQAPDRDFVDFNLDGVWDESLSPREVGASSFMACTNTTYHRYKSIGKRPGNATAYYGTVAQNNLPASMYRWYGEQPYAGPGYQSVFVLAAGGGLYWGSDPGNASTLNPVVGAFTAVNPTVPLSFAPVYDPINTNGLSTLGTDILIICGATANVAPATGQITISGTVGSGGQVITVNVYVAALATITVTYTVLPSDSLTTIATSLTTLINNAIYAGGATGYLLIARPAWSLGGVIYFGSTQGTAAADTYIQLQATVTGSGITTSPTTATNLSGGGGAWSGPLKYGAFGGPNTAPSALSYQITNAFTGCVTWHDHVWYWGDPNNPDTLYASDINQPEGFTFMNQYGAYQVGLGDGDPGIQACIPIGNILYVFKTNSIYAITGYDFQSGEYQFQLAPAILGYGMPSGNCGAILNNTIVFWSGNGFYRLAVGAFELEYIGSPIPLTSGAASAGNQNLVRAVAGDFVFNNALSTSSGPNMSRMLYSSLALFAVDVGRGSADTILVYDDDATQRIGQYAWAKWTFNGQQGNGVGVAAWCPFGHGENSAGTSYDPPYLMWIQPPTTTQQTYVWELGGNATADENGSLPIQWNVTSGWWTVQSINNIKRAHRILLDVHAIPGVTLEATVNAAGLANGSSNPASIFPQQVVTFPETQGTSAVVSQYQHLPGRFPSELVGVAFQIILSETGNNTLSAFEVNCATLDFILEALTG